MRPIPIRIITCRQWGARPPKHGLSTCGKSERFIFHHTAGHHAEINGPKNESEEESCRYARDVQHFHMYGNGWTDSGHNVLICRNGLILQGRWMTIAAIQARHMIVSARCPGQNTQIGMEHEHYGSEPMTPEQRVASARFIAWVCQQYGYSRVPAIDPHRMHFSTSCPANLISDIPRIKAMANEMLVRYK